MISGICLKLIQKGKRGWGWSLRLGDGYMESPYATLFIFACV